MRLLQVADCLLWLVFVKVASTTSYRSDTTTTARLSPLFGTEKGTSRHPPLSIPSPSCRTGTKKKLLTSIRGGSSSGASGTTSNIRQIVSPYWTSFQNLLKDNVEPALKDPNAKIFTPIQKFFTTKKEAAQERQQVLAEQPKEAIYLFSASRVVKLSIAAWICSELLHLMGCFDNPQGVGPKLKELYKEHAEGHVQDVRTRILDWWDEERKYAGIFNLQTWKDPSLLLSKFRSLPPRYQFAVGAGTGLIVSPILWSISFRAFKVMAGVYLFAELNEYWRETSSIGESAVELLGFRGSGGESVNEFLENIRDTVRTTITQPQSLWAEAQEIAKGYDMPYGMPASAKQGFIIGTIVGVIIV